MKQPTLEDIQEKRKLWDINDSRAQKFHYLIGEMIAVDLQPFSVVEDLGFNRLLNNMCPNYRVTSRKYIKDNIVTDIHHKVKNMIQEEINNATFMSFTSDGWTASTANTSFLSLTAHWIDENYEQTTFILRVFPGPARRLRPCIRASTRHRFRLTSDGRLTLRVQTADTEAD